MRKNSNGVYGIRYYLLAGFNRFKLLKRLPDSVYIKIKYRIIFKKKLNLKDPITYNEKLQWLKLYDRNGLYSTLVDKYKVRSYVESKVGYKYLVPLIGAWENVDDIVLSDLPSEFVLKCNHDSGGIVICKNKEELNFEKSKKLLRNSMKVNYYYTNREWPYKNVKPMIVAEKYMKAESGDELKDYKIFCFNGEPKFLYVVSDRNKKPDMKFDFFDIDFNRLDIKQGYEISTNEIKKPASFDEMIRIARILSFDIPHVRIDFYDIKGDLFFGEMTFYHLGGYTPFTPETWDATIGSWLDLPKKRTL